MEQVHCPDGEVLVHLAGIALAEALALDLSDDNHLGGYFCIADNASGEPLDVVRLGDPLPTKEGRYEELAKEKAARLAANPEHDTSYQSRYPVRDRWGGAVRAGNHILSFSGLSPDRLDEALVLVVARAYMGWMNAEVIRRCAKMAELSGNKLYGRLHTGLRQPARNAMLAGGRQVNA